jgi:pimeloyl-ACP methyl ester carboxylesterase
VPFVERPDGVRLHWWEESSDGPAVLVAHSYIQPLGVLEGLLAELRPGHRTVRYDPRGAGESSRQGPYDMGTDVADLVAVGEAAGPFAAVVANGDATNRAVYAALERPELFPYLVSMESVPLAPRQAAGTDSLISSRSVLEALVVMMRADYRSGVSAAIQRGNPEQSADVVRERVDAIVAYIDHEAAQTRLEQWIKDDPGDGPRALGERLVIAYEGAGAWFPQDLTELGKETLPDAQFFKLDGGALSRPDLTAAVVRRITGANAESLP